MTFPLTRSRSRARFFGTPFSPVSLFANGEQGAWYDPSDPTTLFEDAAGTTPTTMETRVRLMLDKSKGLVLGPELVTNGDFSSGTTGWTSNNCTQAVASGELELTATGASEIGSSQPFTCVVGRTYQVKMLMRSASGNSVANACRVRISTQATGGSISYIQAVTAENTNTTVSAVFVATATTHYIQLNVASLLAWGGVGDKAYFDNISVRELAGNHATAPSNADSPILRARYNLLTWSEQFDNAAWTKDNATVTANATVAPDGTTTADKLVEAATTAQHFVYATVTLSDTPNSLSIAAKAGERSIVYVWLQGPVRIGAYFDLSSGTITSTDAGITSAITDLGNGWYRCRVTRATITAGTCYGGVTLVSTGTTTSYAGNGTSGVFIWGADLRTSTDAALNIPAYQRVGNGSPGVFDYDTAGFPPYLAFDGTDDSFSTASIDFSGTPQMTVFAGVTKLSDAADGMLVELSANAGGNFGSFYFTAPEISGGFSYSFASRGTASIGPGNRAELTGFVAPVTTALTAIADISAPLVQLRANGGAASNSDTGNQGAGNYGNYPLFIGRRNNTSIPLNGRIYSLIIRGAATTTPLIASTEQWVAGKMRLPI